MADSGAQLVRIAGAERPPVRCRVNGQAISALAGDTVLTVVLTQAPRLRKFEFGDGYRAGFCLMGACQDCWVEVNNRRVRACSTLVADNMDISTEIGARA
ncbi:(2Fe-2S)-binding protein [Mesorhizobium sp. M1312]|uniref:(2Fe-2S)-binding protein n=1 Tax=unclassified Mesorhizobium TaxID=325217 RepID=UPI00333DBA02